jgi:hypothetical protein
MGPWVQAGPKPKPKPKQAEIRKPGEQGEANEAKGKDAIHVARGSDDKSISDKT